MENRKIRPQQRHEEQMIRKRDREMRHAEEWNNTVKYYEKCGTDNAQFEEWTSPRYYETNNDLVASIKTKQDKQDHLEERRKKLRQLYLEEENSHSIEATRKMADNIKSEKDLDMLKSINDEIKNKEEMQRTHEAEMSLYRNWRGNNSVLRDCQRHKNAKDIKMSWLDQQIEQRMAKERIAETARKQIQERDSYIKQKKAEDEAIQAEIEQRNNELQGGLKKHIEDLLLKDAEADKLKELERIQMEHQHKLAEIEERCELERKMRQEKELVLYNFKQHTRKLQLKSKEIERQLIEDQAMIKNLKEQDIIEKIEDTNKKEMLKESIDTFLELLSQLRELELKRRPQLDFVFESEAREIYNKYEQTWAHEKEMRDGLMKEVVEEVKEQINENARNNLLKQKALVLERETTLERIERHNNELKSLEEEKIRKQQEYKKDLDEQVKEKQRIKRRLNSLEKNRNDHELELLKIDEERLRKEISKINLGTTHENYGKRRFQ